MTGPGRHPLENCVAILDGLGIVIGQKPTVGGTVGSVMRLLHRKSRIGDRLAELSPDARFAAHRGMHRKFAS